ncbi:hypothetical protein [Winogradskya humida]|nr:hypothetical protein [Actinoplanes humidus]
MIDQAPGPVHRGPVHPGPVRPYEVRRIAIVLEDPGCSRAGKRTFGP